MNEITSRENRQVKALIRLMQERKERTRTGLFAFEGIKLLLEAYRSGVAIREVYATEAAWEKHRDQLGFLSELSAVCYQVSQGVCEKLSETRSPQGIFCVCEKLDNRSDAVKICNDGRYMVLDSLQDPGNIGTIIRTAECFGLDGLILTADCPDLYSPKVLRGAMGGAFRLPIRICPDLSVVLEELHEAKIPVYGAALTDDACPLTEFSLRQGCAVLIGNEGNGLSPQRLAQCDRTLIIPMAPESESLNAAVAAAVIMWEMRR